LLSFFLSHRRGEIATQITAWGADRERAPEELEAVLVLSGAVDPPERPPQKKTDGSEDEESEDEGRDKSARMRSAATWTNHSVKNVRSAAAKGDDSDSDFDI